MSSNKHIHSGCVNTLMGTLFNTDSMAESDMVRSSPASQTLHSARTASHRGSLRSQIKDSSFPVLFVICLGTHFFSIDTSATVSPSQSLLCSHLSQVCYFFYIKLHVICLALARAVILSQDYQKPVPFCGEGSQAPSTSGSVQKPSPRRTTEHAQMHNMFF